MSRKLLGLLSCILLISVVGCGDDNGDKKETVCPVDGNCGGSTYKVLAQNWWNWNVSIPVGKHPMLDADGSACAENQPSSGVFYLNSGPPGAGTTKRACKVPANRGLFFPILTSCCWACKDQEDCAMKKQKPSECKADPDTEDYLNTCLKQAGGFPDAAEGMEVIVDGKAIADLKKFRVESGVFQITGLDTDTDRMFPCTAGTRKAATDGHFVYINVLSKGKHTINIKGKHKTYSQDVVYDLDVQ